MTQQFKKSFSEITMPNKDIIVRVNYAPNCTACFTYCYNSISGGYMGLQANTFVDSLRGLLRVCPTFFEIIDHKYKKELQKLGFEQIDPTPEIKRHYELTSILHS